MKELAQIAAIIFILLVGVVAYYAKKSDHETAKSRKYASISSMAAYLICGLSILSLLYVGFGIPGVKLTHKKGEVRAEIIQPAPNTPDMPTQEPHILPDSAAHHVRQTKPAVPIIPQLSDSVVAANANEAFTAFVKIVDFGDNLFGGIISSFAEADSAEGANAP